MSNCNMRHLKQYLIFFLIVLFLLGGLYLKFREYFLPVALVKIVGQEIKVEIAQTPKAWEKGLAGRQKLAENQGMFFVFSEAERRSFWMKGMKFPLDIIWINQGKVVDIAPNVQPDNTPSPALYFSRLPINQVLEVRAGFSEKYGVKIGDEVKILTE